METGYLSVTEAATRLGITPRTVRLWLTSGRLAGERVRGHFGPEWRVLESDLARLAAGGAETAIVSDPLGKLGGNEFRASLALLLQENSALRGQITESVQQLSRLSGVVEGLASSMEKAHAQLESVQSQGEGLAASSRELADYLQEDHELLVDLRKQLEIAMQPRPNWWQRLFRR